MFYLGSYIDVEEPTPEGILQVTTVEEMRVRQREKRISPIIAEEIPQRESVEPLIPVLPEIVINLPPEPLVPKSPIRRPVDEIKVLTEIQPQQLSESQTVKPAAKGVEEPVDEVRTGAKKQKRIQVCLIDVLNYTNNNKHIFQIIPEENLNLLVKRHRKMFVKINRCTVSTCQIGILYFFSPCYILRVFCKSNNI